MLDVTTHKGLLYPQSLKSTKHIGIDSWDFRRWGVFSNDSELLLNSILV